MNDSERSVDLIINSCLSPSGYSSFFLFAGAGSGKTRTLVSALKAFKDRNLVDLVKRGKKITVITFTNAACNEIKERVNFDESFEISTIHAFAWALIKPFTDDIKSWILRSSEEDLAGLKEKDRKGRPGTKAANERASKMRLLIERSDNLNKVRKFKYSPSGINEGWDALQHAEVIKIASDFIREKKLLQEILIGRSPVILIDESQDTQEELISSLLKLEEENKGRLCLGLFGDLMQRIYFDGKPDLGMGLPDHWSFPEKITNYRCPTRVVDLINCIRSESDGHKQVPSRSEAGFVRLFIADANAESSKLKVEEFVAQKMATISGDDDWLELRAKVKTLILEHHMAASRGGFEHFFLPLYTNSATKSGVLDGSLAGLSFLTDVLVPLASAIRGGDEFFVARIIKAHSDLITPEELGHHSPLEKLKRAEGFVQDFKTVLAKKSKVIDLLKSLWETKLVRVPEVFLPILESAGIGGEDTPDDRREKINVAWGGALSASLEELEAYAEYIAGESGFDTHQGVKGRQFARVMAVLDDQQARGNSFSYEKLLGAKEPSERDQENEAQGKETSIDRTRRLFYVACSRAMESLAIVVYTESPQVVKQYSISKGWFKADEVELLS